MTVLNRIIAAVSLWMGVLSSSPGHITYRVTEKAVSDQKTYIMKNLIHQLTDNNEFL